MQTNIYLNNYLQKDIRSISSHFISPMTDKSGCDGVVTIDIGDAHPL